MKGNLFSNLIILLFLLILSFITSKDTFVDLHSRDSDQVAQIAF